MRAKFINEKFEDESDPIDDMKIGINSRIKRKFKSGIEAAEWAVRNLELITQYEFSPNDVIRREGHEVIPRKLANYIVKWAQSLEMGSNTTYERELIYHSAVLHHFVKELRRQGILVENLKSK